MIVLSQGVSFISINLCKSVGDIIIKSKKKEYILPKGLKTA